MILIRFLLISIFILYLVRTVLRLLLPMFFQSVVNKAQQQYQQNNTRQDPPTGRIKVDYIPEGKKSSVPDTEGEFVEYEEVKK